MISFLKMVAVSFLCIGLFCGLVLLRPDFFMPPQKSQSDEVPLKIVILDIDRVLQVADVTAYIQQTVEMRRAELQKDVEGYEKDLRKKETSLKKLQNQNDPAFELAKKDFENEVTDVQKCISGRSKILEKAFHDARSEVIQKVMALVAELAEAEGMKLVLPKNVVMYQEEGYEITERILARLNSDMPTIAIKLPEGK